jgi:hypothetical protein
MDDELVLSGDLPAVTILRMERRGELRRLARGVYTTAPDPAHFVRANLHAIAGRLFPKAIIMAAWRGS